MSQHRFASVPLDAVSEALRSVVTLGMAKTPPAGLAALTASLRAATAACGPLHWPTGNRSGAVDGLRPSS